VYTVHARSAQKRDDAKKVFKKKLIESGFLPCVLLVLISRKRISHLKYNRVVIDQKVYLLTYFVVWILLSGHPVPTPGQDDVDIHLIIFNTRRHHLREPQISPLTIILYIYLLIRCARLRCPFACVYRTGWKMYIVCVFPTR